MIVARTRAELRAALDGLGGCRGLVMTMGALHAGHLTLVRRARELADHVVVSIYVNPLQFGPNEDFEAYPRQLEADLALLEPLGVEVVYAPSDEEVYPRDPLVRIDPGEVAGVLEGATRPGHFAGVLQVVHKVMNLVRPDVAVFGQKDAQQLALIRTMVADLDMGIEIEAVHIARDPDGVAQSSRNAYLSEDERVWARSLSQALHAGRDAVQDAGTDGLSDVLGRAGAALRAADAVMDKAVRDSGGIVRIDYLVLVDPDTFTPVTESSTEGLLAVAAWVGSTRL
ncbi:MAG TPA: pantoate--beta-alanine ligase, partial [Actinomycetales bacterium]|nr:pantoate--beta-alanine ligase [Actinomycetales bacterium]